jgi:hypothetical protein
MNSTLLMKALGRWAPLIPGVGELLHRLRRWSCHNRGGRVLEKNLFYRGALEHLKPWRCAIQGDSALRFSQRCVSENPEQTVEVKDKKSTGAEPLRGAYPGLKNAFGIYPFSENL